MAAHVSPDVGASFISLLKACAKHNNLYRGTRAHHEILRKGLLKDCLDSLVTMYARCGALAEADELLHTHTCSNIIPWTDLIAAYANEGQGRHALDCFRRMRLQGLSPDAVTLVCILKACGSIRASHRGEQIHAEATRQGLLTNNVVVGTALVDMYAKCGALVKAQQVLEELPVRGLISWNALITGYAQFGQAKQALICFERMRREGFSPDRVTFLSILAACGSIKAANKGKQIHNEIAQRGLLKKHVMLGNAVVTMYVKCGALAKAREVLEHLPIRDSVSWSALITGYAQHRQGEQALECFEQMQREGFTPNDATFLCILRACGSIGAINKGEEVHDEVARQGLLRKHVVLGHALVNMYAKCGALDKARRVLEELPHQDVVSWNTLVAGYTQHGQGEQALKCFERMQHVGLSPNSYTLIYILRACASVGLVDNVETYFVNMSRRFGIRPHLEHYFCMIDALGHAGVLEKAVGVLQKAPIFDYSVARWSTLLHNCHALGELKVGRWAFHMTQQHMLLFEQLLACSRMQKS